MSVDPGRLTPDVMKGNSIPFTAVNHRSNATAILSVDYKFRIQLDDRLVDKVADISISPADTVNEVVHFKRVYNDAQKPTNIWEANVVYKQGGIFGGLFTSAGKAMMARNGKIMLNDTLDNIYPKLPNIAKSPLVYNAYVYDNSSRTALLSTNNEGYIVGPNDPLAKVPVTSDFGGKFMGPIRRSVMILVLEKMVLWLSIIKPKKAVCGRIIVTGNSNYIMRSTVHYFLILKKITGHIR